MHVDLRDEIIGRSLFSGLPYEPAETAFISDILRPGMTFVDIGANIGYYSLLAARLLGSTGRIIAFEPDPYNYHLLDANIKLNRRQAQVAMRNIALGSAPGQLTLWKSNSNYGDHRLGEWAEGRSGITVAVDTFDAQFRSIGGGTIDLLKIDVQGFEAKVFSGMQGVFAASPPRVILMEYWPDGIRAAGDNPEQLLCRLLDYGYRVALVESSGSPRSVTLPEVLASIPTPNPASPDAAYVNIALTR
jgi:FkbM family methyltransferase